MPALKFTTTHEWLKVEDHTVTIGITQHAQQLLGDLVFVDLPEEGKVFSKGKEFAVVESVKAASDVYAPISGTVLAINKQLVDNPELINNDPYGAGWLVKMKLEDPAEISALLTEEAYQAIINQEH